MGRYEPSLEEQVRDAASGALADHTANLVLIAKAQMAATLLAGLIARYGNEPDDLGTKIAGSVAMAERILKQLGVE